MERRANLEQTHGKKNKPRADPWKEEQTWSRPLERRANLEQKPWKKEQT